MENTTTAVGLLAAIITLIAAIIPTINVCAPKKHMNSIDVHGNDNVITQDNSIRKNIYVEHKEIIYVEHRENINSSHTSSTTSNDDSSRVIDIRIIALIIALLLICIYQNRVVLLQIIYVLLIIAAFLSILICICRIRKTYLAPIHSRKIVEVIFTITPAIISALFVLQNNLLPLNPHELTHMAQISATILFDYFGISFCLFAQFCVLVVPRIKILRIKKFIVNFAKSILLMIFLPIFLSAFPFLILFLL